MLAAETKAVKRSKPISGHVLNAVFQFVKQEPHKKRKKLEKKNMLALTEHKHIIPTNCGRCSSANCGGSLLNNE